MPGPTSLSLSDTSQTSPHNSELKTPLSTCHSHKGVQQAAQTSWSQKIEFPLKNLLSTLSPSPSPNMSHNPVKDDTSHPPRCSGKKNRKQARFPSPKTPLLIPPSPVSSTSKCSPTRPVLSSPLSLGQTTTFSCRFVQQPPNWYPCFHSCSVQAFSPHKVILSKM